MYMKLYVTCTYTHIIILNFDAYRFTLFITADINLFLTTDNISDIIGGPESYTVIHKVSSTDKDEDTCHKSTAKKL